MIAWFICPYKRRVRLNSIGYIRYCAMDDFTQQIIYKDGGNWSESEVLGNYAVVKVSAKLATLNTITETAGFFKLPVSSLTNSISSLSASDKTLGDFLRFATTRRIKPRYNNITDSLIFDGEVRPCRSIDDVDRSVT